MNNLIPLLFLAVAAHAGPAQDIIDGLQGSGEFILSLFYVVGLIMIFAGISQLKKLGNRTAFMNADAGITGSLVKMGIGALLIFVPHFLDVMNASLWGNAALADANSIAYGTASSSSTIITAIRPIIMVIQFIGMVAMLRGFIILSKASGQGAQPGTISKGAVHVLGGVLAVNIVRTVEIVTNTFGIS